MMIIQRFGNLGRITNTCERGSLLLVSRLEGDRVVGKGGNSASNAALYVLCTGFGSRFSASLDNRHFHLSV